MHFLSGHNPPLRGVKKCETAAVNEPNKGMEPTRRSARLMPGVRHPDSQLAHTTASRKSAFPEGVVYNHDSR
jgi:hypothetical protein